MAADIEQLKNILEAALFANGGPLTLEKMQALFAQDETPPRSLIQQALGKLELEYEAKGIELVKVASGYRIQVKKEVSTWVSRLWEEKPPKYSRATLETMALIAYRQPITRGEIEEVRGVSVSTQIVRTLLEREWVKVVGHREVPGRPALYATTRQFLDYFNLNSLQDLPELPEIKELGDQNDQLDLPDPDMLDTLDPDMGTEEDNNAVDQAAAAVMDALLVDGNEEDEIQS